jgi:hypothetical protein
MTSSAKIVVGAGALIVVGFGVLSLGPFYTEEASFTLTKGGVNGCEVSVRPGDLFTAWYRKVTWHVFNQDCDPQFVSIQDFKSVRSDGTHGSAAKVVAPDPLQRPVPTGAKVDLTATVIGFGGLGHYYYEIWLGPNAANLKQAVDPDIDIWP